SQLNGRAQPSLGPTRAQTAWNAEPAPAAQAAQEQQAKDRVRVAPPARVPGSVRALRAGTRGCWGAHGGRVGGDGCAGAAEPAAAREARGDDGRDARGGRRRRQRDRRAAGTLTSRDGLSGRERVLTVTYVSLAVSARACRPRCTSSRAR